MLDQKFSYGGFLLLLLAGILALWLVYSRTRLDHYLKGARGEQRVAAELAAAAGIVAMAGGTLVATLMGRNDPGFAYNGPLAGLVAVCAGSDVMHPAGALVVGGVAGAIFVQLFTLTQNRWKIDDVLGVWPLHGLCGAWGGIACGIFGSGS